MRIRDVFAAMRYFGIRPLSLRLFLRIIRKTNWFKKRFPTAEWSSFQLSSFTTSEITAAGLKDIISKRPFFPIDDVGLKGDGLRRLSDTANDVLRVADDIVAGKFKYFSKKIVHWGPDIDWHCAPLSSSRWPVDTHWCGVKYFDRDCGDIKLVWELSRFSWVFDLVRAYILTGEPRYSQAFWQLFESWVKNNQPNSGVNWSCGQECALRVLAWCFALFGLLDAEATTNKRIENILIAFALHGDRIEKFILDAITQKTNHALTEAAGLYTLGIIFPFFKNAQRWKNLGKRVLEKEGFRQIYEDGSYVQQSMNYHRLMLHTYLWCLSLSEINGESFSTELKERLLNATEFLYQMQDDATGRLSNYGANDGALILPLNNCDYLDYRPVIQSCWYLLKREKLYEAGPWDEDLVWLFGPAALNAPKADKRRVSCGFRTGGYYTLRGKTSWGMIRCHTYCDRVGHVDPLHLDLWADGNNLLRDCGTYKYFAPDEPELERYFKSIWAHNTIVVDDQSPLRLVSRFIYLPWPKAEVREFKIGRHTVKWQGTHFAYDSSPWNVIHSRRVTVDENDRWQICDELQGRGRHKLELRWHIPVEAKITHQESSSVDVQLSSGWMLNVESGNGIEVELLQADPKGGWESLYYAHKTPIRTLSVVTRCQLPLTFRTTVWK